jgi:hypothetical protein
MTACTSGVKPTRCSLRRSLTRHVLWDMLSIMASNSPAVDPSLGVLRGFRPKQGEYGLLRGHEAGLQS